VPIICEESEGFNIPIPSILFPAMDCRKRRLESAEFCE